MARSCSLVESVPLHHRSIFSSFQCRSDTSGSMPNPRISDTPSHPLSFLSFPPCPLSVPHGSPIRWSKRGRRKALRVSVREIGYGVGSWLASARGSICIDQTRAECGGKWGCNSRRRAGQWQNVRFWGAGGSDGMVTHLAHLGFGGCLIGCCRSDAQFCIVFEFGEGSPWRRALRWWMVGWWVWQLHRSQKWGDGNRWGYTSFWVGIGICCNTCSNS
jgi:hypothetical protein